MFQSTPASQGGRYTFRGGSYAVTTSFNPRPPRRAGDTKKRSVHPAPGGGFNPRPPRRAGDTDPGEAQSYLSLKFQSTPASQGGRYTERPTSSPVPPGFNPRPPRRAGDTSNDLYVKYGADSFNPRPPRRAGDTARDEILDTVPDVSIHARLAGRAIREPERHAERLPGSFNPRPPRRAGDTARYILMNPMRKCFNPRPPRRAGDTDNCCPNARRFHVSIHARLAGRAILNLPEALRSLEGVSIHARLAGRAILPRQKSGSIQHVTASLSRTGLNQA